MVRQGGESARKGSGLVSLLAGGLCKQLGAGERPACCVQVVVWVLVAEGCG